MSIRTYVSIITLNVNGLNASTKDTDWLNGYKNKTHICAAYKRPRDTYTLTVKRWRKIFHVNGNQKKAGVAILISDKIDFKIKNIIRDKEGHYIMIKGSIQKENTTIVNICAPNIEAPQYIRETLKGVRGEINSNTVIVGDFNPIFTPMDRSTSRK